MIVMIRSVTCGRSGLFFMNCAVSGMEGLGTRLGSVPLLWKFFLRGVRPDWRGGGPAVCDLCVTPGQSKRCNLVRVVLAI